MNSRVQVLAFDQDVITVVGGASTFTVDASCILNGYWGSDSANSSKYKWTRFFTKGGNYKVTITYLTNSNNGKIDIGLDSSTNNVFSQIDTYTGSLVRNNTKSTIIEVARGYHDIVALANGKNASSSNYFIAIQSIKFDLIQEYTEGLYKDDRPAQINQGSMVLLGKHTAVVAESTFTFNFADVDIYNKYSEVYVEVHGETTASLALQLQINGISSGNYFQNGYTSIGSTLANVSKSSQTSIELIGTNIATGGNSISANLKIRIDQSNGYVFGEWFGGVIGTGNTSGMAGINGIGSNKITSITVKTSTSTWIAGTVITIFGVRKV